MSGADSADPSPDHGPAMTGRRLPQAAAAGAMLGLVLVPSLAAAAVRRTPVVEVVAQVGPAVVNIATDQRVRNPFDRSPFGSLLREFFDAPDGRSNRYVENALGSGVIIDPSGFLVTNEHVISGASRIRVTLADGRTLLAEVVGTSHDSDLAVLKIDAEGPFPAVTLGSSSDLLIGETVIAIGNPFGFSSSVTTGVVSAVGRSIAQGEQVFTDFIQTDALINPGNSGGPLLDIDGHLIGVNNAVYAPAQGIGFAIPVDRVRRVVDDLIHYGEVRRAWFGLVVDEQVRGGRDADLLTRRSSVVISQILADSPAAASELREGDRITQVNGHPVDSLAAYDTALSGVSVGDAMSVQADRHGRPVVSVIRGVDFPADRAVDIFRQVTGMTLVAAQAGRFPRQAGQPGLQVTAVTPGSPADRIGIERGDLIVRVDSAQTDRLADLTALVPRILVRRSFFLVVVRGRYAYRLTFRLG
ncbi:MAG: trypsin-like peptidase domain-containing protein [Acidobacteriota bacterium]